MNKKMLKRSLLLSALMTAVITGNALAATEYVCGEGKSGFSVDQSNIVNEGETYRVIGGFQDYKGQTFNGYVTVNSGKWDMVMGGCYVSGDDKDYTMNIGSTSVVINGGTFKHVVGGTGANNANNVESATANRTAHLVIKGGQFGNEALWKHDTLENLVVGGDHVKNYPDPGNKPSMDNESNLHLASAKTEINVDKNTKFNSLIIGGSLANQYYPHVDSALVKTTVDVAETNITGGIFKQAIVAGGVAMGTNAVSNVDQAILNISNATVEADIFTAGMVRYADTKGKVGATVNESFVTIKNSTVANIYNTRGFAQYDKVNGWQFGAEKNCTNGTNGSNVSKPGVAGFAEGTVTNLKLVNTTADTVDITKGSVELRIEGEKGATSVEKLVVGEDYATTVTASADGDANDAAAAKGDYSNLNIQIGGQNIITKTDEDGKYEIFNGVTEIKIEEGEIAGAVYIDKDGVAHQSVNVGNTGIAEMSSLALMTWRQENNDMNKRLGELRNSNGEHGIWTRMTRGESKYNSIKNQYNAYQIGYDEKVGSDKAWTVGAALTYTEGKSTFVKGSGENTHKGFAIYGSKLNEDGSFIDLIAKYSRLENEFEIGKAQGDYDTNGYSISAEYGKRLAQGNGFWIEPQVELTYGLVEDANYIVGRRHVAQDDIESLVGRVGFSLGKDIKQGNVYVRASYLYDFDGETKAVVSKYGMYETFEQDLGGGWFEVGVGTNYNLSDATYLYFDVEKTYGGDVATPWQWNAGVRYSF